MKAEADIRKRLNRLLRLELSRRLEQASSRLPHLCVHNYRHSLDGRKSVEGSPNDQYNKIVPFGSKTIGLCMLGSNDYQNWNGTICEDPIDAQRCPYFQLKVTKNDIWQEFRQQLADQEWLQDNLPEVATLLWCLEEKSSPIGWWTRLRFRLFRVKTPPVLPQQTVSLEKLGDE